MVSGIQPQSYDIFVLYREGVTNIFYKRRVCKRFLGPGYKPGFFIFSPGQASEAAAAAMAIRWSEKVSTGPLAEKEGRPVMRRTPFL